MPAPHEVPALYEVQAAFRQTLLGGDAAAALALIAPDGLDPAERLGVHRNNVATSLSDALRAAFPAVCRLVGDGFFAYAAHEFIAAHPPAGACLAEYGAGFADFLAAFPPCRDLAYLPDVARLEFLVQRAAHAADAPAATPQDLAVAPEAAGRLLLDLNPAFAYLASPFPVEALWRENRASDGGAVSLDAGAARLEITRRDGRLVIRDLAAGVFAFRRALAQGAALEAAADAAIAAAADFALDRALADLFRDGAVAAVSLSPLP